MPTSDSSPKRRSKFRGFTLLEVLVVILIMGLMAAAAAPRLNVMYDRIDFALARQSFEQRLNGLAYDAFSANTDLILMPTTERGVERLETLGVAAPDVMAQRIKAPAPDGWDVYIDEPIIYRASGYCRGGALSVKVGTFIANYVLHPPFCELEEVP